MMMLYLFLLLFASQLLLVAPYVIEKEQVQNREEPPSLEVNKTTDPKTSEAPWADVHFPLEEAEHHDGTCRRDGMFVSFAEIGLSDYIIAPEGFDAFHCKGKCSSTQREKFPNRSVLMTLIEKKALKSITRHAVSQPNWRRYQLSFLKMRTPY